MVSPAKEKITLFTDKLLIYPGMQSNGPLPKSVVFGAQAYVLIMTAAAWLAGIPALFQYGVTLLVIGSTASLTYHFSNRFKGEVIVYIGMQASVLITLYFILQLGGILSSGGLVFAGAIAIILSAILNRKNWSLMLTGIYLCTVIFASFYSTAEPEAGLDKSQNILFFALNGLFLGVYIYILADNLLRKTGEAENAKMKLEDERSFLLRAKSRLYSEISDNLISRLNTIVDYTREAEGSDKKNGEAVLSRIGNECTGLINRIELMNELAKVESRSVRIRKVQSDFIKFSHYITGQMAPLTNGYSIRIDHHSAINQFNLDFDPGLVYRVYSLLIADGIRRSGSKGEIRVNVSREQENNWKDLLVISISDHGTQLEEELAQLVFQPDYELIYNSISEDGSTAPGLMMAGELIRMVEGKIYVKRSEKKGTTFRIILPAHNASRFVGHEDLKKALEPPQFPVNGKSGVMHKAPLINSLN